MDLKSINGIGPEARELLEAAGYGDVESLAHADPAVLAAELARANEVLRLARQNISHEKIHGWIAEARSLMAPPSPARDQPRPLPREQLPVNYESSKEVMEMLAHAPLALPLPAKVLMENHVSVSQIPSGILLNHFVGDLDVRVSEAPPPPPPDESAAHENSGQSYHDLIRSAKPSTNKGRNPNSRRFIRGVLHSHPQALYFGALVTAAVVLLIPLSVVAAVLLVLSREKPEAFFWVSPWFLALPLLLMLLGPAYLIWGLAGRCRICNQRLFVHRTHRKNSKAHYFPVIGYVLPLCLHILAFKWFRCTHCGTAVRVKE